MKLPRRQFLNLTASAAAFPITVRIASALDYPARPVHIIVGFPPASGPDIVARLVGQRLSERLGPQFIVEDRPGAGGSIATQIVVNAPADGYTLLLATSANAINATLYPNLNFNFVRDVAPIAITNRVPFVMVGNIHRRVWSPTTKQASNSSTDQGGGKRRARHTSVL
jgi:tripartite-type tricarboxylate transporter receptor subunit TctC